MAVNLNVTLALLEAAHRSAACRHFLFVSSAGVYEQGIEATLEEAQATGGSGLYSATKLAAELVVQQYSRLFDLQTTIVRPTSLFGPGEAVRSSRPTLTPLHRLVHAARTGSPVWISGHEARGDWIYVDDAAEAVRLLLVHTEGSNRVFNLSSGRPQPFANVVREVATILPLRIEEGADMVIDSGSDRAAIIANRRLRELVPWVPRPIGEALRSYVAELNNERLQGLHREGRDDQTALAEPP